MSNNHQAKIDLDALHTQGACLTRHQSRTEGHLCSHQWQARVQAEAHPGVYDHPRYHSLCGDDFFKTAARVGKKSGKLFPRNYASPLPDRPGFWKERPTCAGEWNLGVGSNFNHYIEPYWHNAHHIIPNGALKAAIATASQQDARLDDLIRAGLLKATYNLNDKRNMVILPMEQIVAAAMRLPRHLLGDQVGPGQDKEFRSHTNYSRKVEDLLKDITKDYKSALAKALDDHPEPPNALSKKRLEDLSDTLYSAIIQGGADTPGAALSEINLPSAAP